jgi:3-hydroxyisobutyrate dehydrogenase-like beta-hydroxyacid dehydrogenase
LFPCAHISAANIIFSLRLGREGRIHIIPGGAGVGSTVKMVNQLLAGVHVVVAAEALALAAKVGLDVEEMYQIVNGAAGASCVLQGWVSE